MSEIKLSSSDGTMMSVSDLNQAVTLIMRTMCRIEEINNGSYRNSSKKIKFNTQTSPELSEMIQRLKSAVLLLAEAATPSIDDLE